jgi:hypothetical protein
MGPVGDELSIRKESGCGTVPGVGAEAGRLGREPAAIRNQQSRRYDGAQVRKLLVGSAQYILGRFGPDTDLRRYGLRLCERGGKNAKKRAGVAVARKLAVLLHRLMRRLGISRQMVWQRVKRGELEALHVRKGQQMLTHQSRSAVAISGTRPKPG